MNTAFALVLTVFLNTGEPVDLVIGILFQLMWGTFSNYVGYESVLVKGVRDGGLHLDSYYS